MTQTFTSLRHPVEKLLEAEYFFKRSLDLNGLEFQFVLNAFLSASRSVTFVLQKAMSEVSGFSAWYGHQQSQMKADASMRFFVELRNLSQKEGPVSYVGCYLLNGLCTYRFVGCSQEVPLKLQERDIRDCCAEQLSKLGMLLLKCQNAFPFASCPGRAFTTEGKAALGYDWADVAVALGLPDGYIEVAGIPDTEILRFLSKDVEPLDIASIERIAAGRFYEDGSIFPFTKSAHDDGLVNRIADTMSSGTEIQPRTAFLRAVLERIDDTD